MGLQKRIQKGEKTHEEHAARRQHGASEWRAHEDSAAVESALALLPKKMRRIATVEHVSGSPPNDVRFTLTLPHGRAVAVVAEKQGDQWELGSADPFSFKDVFARHKPMFFAVNPQGNRILCDQLSFALAFAAGGSQRSQGVRK